MKSKAPPFHKGKRLLYDEKPQVDSPFNTKGAANFRLSSLQKEHPTSEGWVKIYAQIIRTESGVWEVHYHYAQYR